ncbi:MAG TPA: DNA polymerase, partial [Actinomycetes bacterium]|nr:DNA polymerase [Actinomycetes bacterium]
DGVFANVDKNTPKLRESLAAHEEQVRRNATATPLVRDVPLDVDLDSLRMGQWDPDAVRDLFRFLEFNTLYPRFVEATGAAAPPPVATERIDVVLRRAADLEEAAKAVQGAVSLAAAWAGEEGRSALLGVAVAGGPERPPERPTSPDPEAWWIPSEMLPADFGPYSTHRAKELMRALDLRAIDLRGLEVDTAIAAYLLDPAESQYLLEDLTVRFLGLDISSPEAPPAGQLDLSGTAPDPAEDAARRAVAVARLAPALGKAMESRGLQKLYDEIERPLVRVLARMEKVGVRVDVDLLRRIYDGLVAEGRRLEEEIQDLCGSRFLVNSTQQLRRVLFDELGLQPQKKTKTGFSTDAASLEKLRGLHPVIEPLLRYREVEKLRSTYGESLLGEVAQDGRIHASFNQTVARTGRLSSDRPNLHNIPIRTEEGRRIRRAFIPAEGRRFLVNSTQQLRRVLFDELGLQPQKKTKTGFSTDAASLEKLRGLHPVIEPLLRYREVEKLRPSSATSPSRLSP